MKSKSIILIYVIVLLWAFYGALGIYYNVNLPSLAGYYASLTLFVSTYLWGEYKRSSEKTTVFSKGKNSTRESIIYITILLWNILGFYGIWKNLDMNNLTVYFSALSPFVSSYIIYKTNKGADLPIFNGKSQSMVDNNINNAHTSNITETVNIPYSNMESTESESTENNVAQPTSQATTSQVTEDTF